MFNPLRSFAPTIKLRHMLNRRLSCLQTAWIIESGLAAVKIPLYQPIQPALFHPE